MVSVCLPSDALSQHLPFYLGFSYLGCGVSLHSCSSKGQPLLLTLDERYLLTAAPPDLEHGVAPLGPPEPVQPLISDSFKTKNLTLFRNQALGTISKGSNIAFFYSIVTRVWRVSKRF